MSKRGRDRAQRRLDQLQEHVRWALRVVSDPEEARRDLDLTPEEMDEFVDAVQTSLHTLRAELAAALTVTDGTTRVEIEGQDVTLFGPLPRLRALQDTEVDADDPAASRRGQRSVSIVVGPSTPRPSRGDLDMVGPVIPPPPPPWENEGMVGPLIPPDPDREQQ